MMDDIRPPRLSKTKTAKPKSPAPKAEPKNKPLELDKIMPPKPEITIPIDENGKSRLSKNPIKNLKHFHPKHWPHLNRIEKFMLLGGTLLILLVAGISTYILYSQFVPQPLHEKIVRKPKAPPKPVTVEAPLTGLPIDPALAKRPVTGIMIENSDDARPQSGLQDAGVVYEAIAEGGITRFIALFQDTRPSYVGPVRSLRPYYIDFATPWDASFAHVGGSPDALSQIRAGGKDLDQFFNSGSYWRQGTRDAPHNVYTSFDLMDALNQAKGYTSSAPKPWSHKKDAPLKTPTAKSINVNISSYDFNSHYDYDPTSNSYNRSEAGQPHIVTSSATDASGVQLHPKVVIVVVMSYGINADGHHSDYGVTGSGNVYVFQDGGVTQGTWEKADRSSQFVFKDSSDKEIKLNAGQAWVTAIGGDNMVSYSP